MTFVRTNILNPYRREILSTDSYPTLIDFLQDKYPKGFDCPVDISVNAFVIKVDDYDVALNNRDVVVLLDRSALPALFVGGSWFLTALANLAISVTLSYVANKLFAPDSPEDRVQPSTVYTVNSGQNSARYGSPVPVIYGKVRMYPSMIAQPYYKFIDNVEYLYHVLCVSQGNCTTDTILIGDDDITNAGDIEWKILYQDSFYNIPLNGFGVHITKTLVSPSNMEIIDDISVESERYTIRADASSVEFDYMYPQGLYYTKSDGEYVITSSAFIVRVYNTLGSLIHSETITDSSSSPEAIQKTISIDLSSYSENVTISFQRTLFYNHSRDIHGLYIKRVKEIYPNENFTNLYGDITVLVCKIKATNSVSAAGQVRVNGYFERTDVGNTIKEVLTDIYTNTKYGAGLNEDDLVFPDTLETVDCVYESNMTIFDAMRKPAIAQKYSLFLAGMDVILKKDTINTVSTAMYNEMNILRNTLKVNYLFKEQYSDYDGYESTYIDGNGWIPRTKLYPPTSIRPKKVDLFGVVEW